jgi:hypothetical protein
MCFSNSHSMGASAGTSIGQGLGPGATVACNQRTSPALVLWCFRVVVFNA